MLAGLMVLVGAIALLWFAPSSYEVFKALHVIAIVIWVGGDITLTTLGIVFERRGDAPTLAALGQARRLDRNTCLYAGAVCRISPWASR